ncbi:MAG: thioredoxin-disulfide reductase [Deltaproteobacteria bacterium]|nr:thioredoxin-disulfide reductase [Deltaproteobacteria bacterium]
MSTSEHQPAHASLVIVGSGPAGLTAAIYAARAMLQPVLITGYEPGGQLTTTTEVENFPGFAEGIIGTELMIRMRAQAERFGTRFIEAAVQSIDLRGQPKRVATDEGEITAGALIIASGATARYLGIPGEQELKGFGVSACATCDGFFFTDKEIAVVGGGDSALEEAVFLTRFARKVTIIHRRDALRGSKIMQARARGNPKIRFLWSTVVEEVLGDRRGGVSGLKVRNAATGETGVFPTEGLFLAVGHTPNTTLLQGQLELDPKGYIVTAAKSTRTSVPGVFAAGDVQDARYRQAITAAGSGCMAALDAQHWLEEQQG